MLTDERHALLPTPLAHPTHRAAQAALFLAVMANSAGQAFLLAILPPLGRRLGFADVETGAILSIAALALIVAAPLWGFWSESRGRRPAILTALAAGAVAPLVLGFVIGERMTGAIGSGLALALLFLIRTGQTLLSAGLLPANQAYVADVTAPDRRARGMGLIGAAYGFGAITGAALAWRFGGDLVVQALVLLSLLAAMAMASVAFLAAEPNRHRQPAVARAGRLAFGQIWPFLAITLVAVTAHGIVQQVLALRLQDTLGFSSEESITKAGLALMATALAMIVVQGGVLRVARLRPEMLLVAGAPLASMALCFAAFSQSYAQMLAAVVTLGIALGLMLPGNLAALSLRAGPSAQSKVAGVNVIGQGIGLVVGPFAGAALHQFSHRAPFLAAAMLMFLAAALALHTLRQQSRKK